ncbi:hypothetical protein [Denitromonas iodatirespirans]|uniref:Half a barrel domain-containing protein n=1 Tax=Denitromonas iodatirespirans TaxID=2795389 RepID=A0A944DCL8_DENI1|nr:hypothetical protein [Denitromonas iodatirespirans]MBT0962997.1 hypothetical protein [Denitromonas iodatirespirans]
MNELEHMVGKAQQAARGGFGGLSTGEKLAAALILNRPDWLEEMNYTIAEAIDRIGPEWLSLLPAAARTVAESTEVISKVAQGAKSEEVLARYTSEDKIDVGSELVTYGETPGYRDVSLTFDIWRLGAMTKHRICLRLSPTDGETVSQHILEVHRHAWKRGTPLDMKPGEIRPAWIA